MGPMTGPTLVIEQKLATKTMETTSFHPWREQLLHFHPRSDWVMESFIAQKWESWHWLQRLSIIDDNENWDGFFSSMKGANLLHFHTTSDKVTESFIGPMKETTLAPTYEA
jgi:hypothetical protein